MFWTIKVFKKHPFKTTGTLKHQQKNFTKALLLFNTVASGNTISRVGEIKIVDDTVTNAANARRCVKAAAAPGWPSCYFRRKSAAPPLWRRRGSSRAWAWPAGQSSSSGAASWPTWASGRRRGPRGSRPSWGCCHARARPSSAETKSGPSRQQNPEPVETWTSLGSRKWPDWLMSLSFLFRNFPGIRVSAIGGANVIRGCAMTSEFQTEELKVEQPDLMT